MKERDCATCKHYVDDEESRGCELWECEFEQLDFKKQIERLRKQYKNLVEKYREVKLSEVEYMLDAEYGIKVGSDVMYTHPYGRKMITERCRVCLDFPVPVNIYSDVLIHLYKYRKDGQLSSKYYRACTYEFKDGRIAKIEGGENDN